MPRGPPSCPPWPAKFHAHRADNLRKIRKRFDRARIRRFVEDRYRALSHKRPVQHVLERRCAEPAGPAAAGAIRVPAARLRFRRRAMEPRWRRRSWRPLPRREALDKRMVAGSAYSQWIYRKASWSAWYVEG